MVNFNSSRFPPECSRLPFRQGDVMQSMTSVPKYENMHIIIFSTDKNRSGQYLSPDAEAVFNVTRYVSKAEYYATALRKNT